MLGQPAVLTMSGGGITGACMADLVICTQELSRDFGPVRAVDGLSLRVERGTIFGFLGPNGSGKTTTIRLLLGLLQPSAGRAEVLGFDTLTQGHEIRARAGALLEDPGLYERLSAEDNLEFYGRVWRLPVAERRARIRELLTRVGLWARRKESVGRWSRGMRQKLAVARALLHRPALVFLDEPTAGLDPVAATELGEDLAALAAREGVSVFLTTHDLVEAQRLCDCVAVIRQGKLLAYGRPDELRARVGGPCAEVVGRGWSAAILAQVRAQPSVAAAELRDDRLVVELRGEAGAAPVVKLLVGAGVEVEEVRRSRPSLQEAYVRLVEAEP